MNGNKVRNSFYILVLVILGGIIFYGFYRPYAHNFSQIFPNEIKILVVGDMMLDRNVANTIDRVGFEKYFSGVADIINDADIAVVNLEGPFTIFPSVTQSLKSKELKFTFSPSLAPQLKDLGFDVLGLANNHTFNFGTEGFRQTKNYIISSGMIYYGDPNNESEISTVITKDGIKVGFVGFHEFYYKNFDKVFAEVERLRPLVDVLIVSPHWGPEYEKKPTEKMVKWAHDFIDSGADAVIGAHPHVVGEIEEYKGKKIYYSLGNFAFDQYFSEETMKGLGVIINVEKKLNATELYYENVEIRVGREGLEWRNSGRI